ncbi:MAG: hypothetical protein KJI71_01290 [Patescibacteria group bacterium]|nr:hypothetical protein [Patescibacteria group bacterium]
MKAEFYPEVQTNFMKKLPPNTLELLISFIHALKNLNDEEEVTSDRKWFIGYET